MDNENMNPSVEGTEGEATPETAPEEQTAPEAPAEGAPEAPATDEAAE